MATFIETTVEVDVHLSRTADGSSRVTVRARSLSAEGVVVRTAYQDVTDQLPPAKQTEALDLLDAAVNHFKNIWSIA